MEQRFISSNAQPKQDVYHTKWQAPSNIALVKYWGKTTPQLPKNASLSFTLTDAQTQTEVNFTPLYFPTKKVSFSILFEGKEMPSFQPKIEAFFNKIIVYQPFLLHYKVLIVSKNTFPHSSGIASSASSMAALAACLVDFESHLTPMDEKLKLEKISFLARLGSGSACRSVQGPMMTWGIHPSVADSSDFMAITVNDIHPIFTTYCDTILLVDKGQKQVSSTLGHKLMHNHPYAAQRFIKANEQLMALLTVLKSGNLDDFITIVEKEALDLHAMMMTSDPYFILMQPNTLHIINAVWLYRAKTKTPLCFTLDAGANVHLLYPNDVAASVKAFIVSDLLQFCQNRQCVHDMVGTGIKKF
mgnify:FL=1